MTQANKGNKVKVNYTGKLENGTVFGSSPKAEPLEFTLGEGRVIPGFENALIGMEPGESKTTTIPVSQAYGPRDHGKVYLIDREKFPPGVHVGQQYQMGGEKEGAEVVTVTNLSEQKVTVDGNHPLAGQDLTFDIELLEVA
jgi:peptidylprolyl isomerase